MDRAEERQRPTPLVGRARDVDLLEGFLARAAERGAALVLTGDAGVGLSALLDTAARAATTAGTRVLSAAGAEAETDVDNAGLNQLLLPVLGALGSLSDVQREVLDVSLGLRAGEPADRLVVSTAVLTALRELAADAPVLLVVDDLQWLDRESVRVVGFVAHRLAGVRIGVLAACRLGSSEAPPLAGIATHEARPLPDGAADELLRIRFPTLAESVRRRVLAAAQGNPLALVELPAALTGPQQAGVAALPEVLPLGSRLRAGLGARMSGLPAGTRHLLLMGALDRTGDLGLLRAAAPDEDRLDALGPAEQAQLVRVDVAGRTLSWRHPLVPAAVVELATSGERRRAHRALAAVLEGAPERRGQHLSEAAVGSDEEAADLLDRAAHRALRTGDGVHAVTGLLRRARSADPAAGQSLQAAVAAAHHLLNTEGDVDRAHGVLVRAIETAQRDGAGADELDDALHGLLVVCHFGGRPENWQPLDAAVDRLDGRVGPVLAVAARTLGDPVATTGEDLARLDAVIDGLDREVDLARIVRTGIAAFYVDRLDDCRAALERVAADGRRGGAVASAVQALMMLCHEAFGAGRWDDARRAAREGVDLGEASGYRLVSLPGVYCLALLAAVEGDTEAGAEADRGDGRLGPSARGAHGRALRAPRGRAVGPGQRGPRRGLPAGGRDQPAGCPRRPRAGRPGRGHGPRRGRRAHRPAGGGHGTRRRHAGVRGLRSAAPPRAPGRRLRGDGRTRGRGRGPVRGGPRRAAGRRVPVRVRPGAARLRRAPAPFPGHGRRAGTAGRGLRDLLPVGCRAMGRAGEPGAACDRYASGPRLTGHAGRAHAAGARDRDARGDRADQQADRRAAVPVPPDGERPPLPDLPQARDRLPGGVARRPHPAPGSRMTDARGEPATQSRAGSRARQGPIDDEEDRVPTYRMVYGDGEQVVRETLTDVVLEREDGWTVVFRGDDAILRLQDQHIQSLELIEAPAG